jgi:nitrite reductase/ring-hydroxylating ferredoxin subunit
MIIERTRWHPVRDARLTHLAEGTLLRIIVRKQALVFVRIKGTLRAMDDQCPHQGAALSGGWVEDCYVVCPFHQFHYNSITGKSKHGSTVNVPVYPIQETTEGILVGFPYTSISLFGWKLW